MSIELRPSPRRWLRLAAVLLAGGLVLPARADADPAAALQAQRAALQPQLRASAFGEPLVLRSRGDGSRVEGEIFADLAQPFAGLEASLGTPAGLCELLVLHLNVRGCAPAAGAAPGVELRVGPKLGSSGAQEYRMRYALAADGAAGRHLRVTLSAAEGPLAMRDIRLVLEAMPVDARHSFVHLSYAYGYGALARIAMGAYLATAGRDKVGFSVVGRDAEGRPTYVQGERAAVERNAMRYYLALQALKTGGGASREDQRLDRLRAWFALTERYAPQLHEYELADYLREKRLDFARMALR